MISFIMNLLQKKAYTVFTVFSKEKDCILGVKDKGKMRSLMLLELQPIEKASKKPTIWKPATSGIDFSRYNLRGILS